MSAEAETKTNGSTPAEGAADPELAEFLKLKEYSAAEISEHTSDDDVWIIIDARVYDITTFKHDHPGGGDVLMDVAGQDATEAFEDIFHSENAREQLPDLCIGRVKGKKPNQNNSSSSSSDEESGGLQYGFLFLLIFLIAAAVYQVFFVQGGDDSAVASAATSTATGEAGEL